jgi:hypothetical protein
MSFIPNEIKDVFIDFNYYLWTSGGFHSDIFIHSHRIIENSSVKSLPDELTLSIVMRAAWMLRS